MEAYGTTLSKWFYLGIVAVLLGGILIFYARGNTKTKLMENGYLIFILGWVGIIAEFTDFATVLLIFVVVCAIILLIDKFWFKSKRKEHAAKPHYVYYAKEFFPVVLAVWVLRSFLFEAYQIPSSSMRPDLIVGDFILVSKYDYGLRMPISNKVMIPVHQVERGDVVVFKDPTTPNRDLIKRVIGLPGDTISYVDKKLRINGLSLNYQADGSYDYSEKGPDGDVMLHNQRLIENLTGDKHPIIVLNQYPPVFNDMVQDFPYRNNCQYNEDGFTCKVPAGHYFMMGDNRDNSLDSRYWGFVPNQNILGRAIYVWMNFRDLSRIGVKIK